MTRCIGYCVCLSLSRGSFSKPRYSFNTAALPFTQLHARQNQSHSSQSNSHQTKAKKAGASRAASHESSNSAIRPRGHLRPGESYIICASWLCARRDEPRVLVRLLLLRLRLGPTVTPVCGPCAHGFGVRGWWRSELAVWPATGWPVVQALAPDPLARQPD